MFVPRAIRLKGVKESQRPKVAKPPAPSQPNKNEANSKDALAQAMGKTSTNSPAPQQDVALDTAGSTRGPRFTAKPITPEYIAQLAAGIELIFTDYAHQEKGRSRWLRDRCRVIDGEENFVHLTAILEHPNIAKLKPEATQILLKQALHDHPSDILELSRNKYYVRRRPSTNPLPFVPTNSFDIVDDEGLSFWDQRTIYVEPHLRNISPTPARVAHWLAEHGQLKPKWLPIQAVHTLWNSCAFVVLSGNVMHEGTWNKWRETGKPDNWKILTKMEHTKRTAEYLAVLEKENPRGMRKIAEVTHKLPPIAQPATLPIAFDPLPENASSKVEDKKKRKRRKPAKSAGPVEGAVEQAEGQATQGAFQGSTKVTVEVPQEVRTEVNELATNRKKRKRRKSGRPITATNKATDDVVDAPDESGEPERKRR